MEAKKRQLAGLKKGESPVVELIPQREDVGRARDKAAAAVGVSPRYVQDAKKLEAAACGAMPGYSATLEDGVRADRQGASIEAPTQDEAAQLLNIGRASVQRARIVLNEGAISASGLHQIRLHPPLHRSPERRRG